MHDREFDELWTQSAVVAKQPFDPTQLKGLPEPAQLYLAHAIATGALLATAVRLRMHGEIKLKHRWYPFTADQVISWQRGFVWRARVQLKGLPVTGSDRWIDGKGEMKWKLLGLIPIVTASGPDISRSALGRLQIESILLPTVLLGPDVHWSATNDTQLGVDLQFAEHPAHLDLGIAPDGQLRTVVMQRWGDPDETKEFRTHSFGGIIADEKDFAGITIPTTLRIGWFFGTERFAKEGEFFRVTIDHAEFR